MGTDFLSRLNSGEVLVADGATGTNLQSQGLAPGKPAEEWVLEEPNKILALHRSFVAAGSDIVLTCSFTGNRFALRKSLYADRVSELNRRAAELARQAADEAARGVLVAGSMGPTGELVEPHGSLIADDVVAAFAEQARALEDGGADLLVLETFFALEEAQAAIEGVTSASELPLVCSFSYDRGTRTMMGVRPASMVESLGGHGLVAVGANCGTTPENMEKIVTELVASGTTLPIWAKPNAGLPEGEPPVYKVRPSEMAGFARRYVEIGARVVGGCCGTTAEHVRAIADALAQ